MIKILIALTIGIFAGIIDIIPMVIQKLDKRATIAAFFHYLVLGLIIPFVDWDIISWIKGMIIGILLLVPTLIIVTKNDKKAMIPMIISSIILGGMIGFLGDKFVVWWQKKTGIKMRNKNAWQHSIQGIARTVVLMGLCGWKANDLFQFKRMKSGNDPVCRDRCGSVTKKCYLMNNLWKSR